MMSCRIYVYAFFLLIDLYSFLEDVCRDSDLVGHCNISNPEMISLSFNFAYSIIAVQRFCNFMQ